MPAYRRESHIWLQIKICFLMLCLHLLEHFDTRSLYIPSILNDLSTYRYQNVTFNRTVLKRWGLIKCVDQMGVKMVLMTWLQLMPSHSTLFFIMWRPSNGLFYYVMVEPEVPSYILIWYGLVLDSYLELWKKYLFLIKYYLFFDIVI